MTAAVSFNNVTKQFLKPGPSRRGWSTRISERIPGAGVSTKGKFSGLGTQGLMEEKLAIDHLTFTVHEAEIFGVVGQSGTGKSTLIRLAAALLQPDEGDVRVFGFNTIRQPNQVQHWINRFSIGASFLKQLSTIENLIQAARMAGISTGDALLRAENLLKKLGMDQSAMLIPMEQLSEAMLQLVTFTRAIISRPRLLLLDDPAYGLDADSGARMMKLIHGWRAETGGTVIITGRRLQEMSLICDRIISIQDGGIGGLDAPEVLDIQLPLSAQIQTKPVEALTLESE